MNKPGFTLIELLLVIAILGILAAVGIPMFQGYIAEAKGHPYENNHRNVVLMTHDATIECQVTGAKLVEFDNKSFDCSGAEISKGVVFYANDVENIKNPYNGDKCCINQGWPDIGYTAISENDRLITIKTRYLKDGVSKYLLDTVKF